MTVTTDPRKTMGAHLKAVRQRVGYSRAELAAALGVHPSAVTQWENGENAPRLTHMVALREHLGEPSLYTGVAA